MAAGDGCIVETSRGVEFGRVVVGPKEVPEEEVVQPLKQVIRCATQEDLAKVEQNRQKAEEAFDIALRKIAEHGLPMKLLEAEYTLDESKLIFSFTAEGRVDFRELVKDLAAIFRTRIELRQVGVRDEAKMIGGLGPCGRGLCCATFLGDFAPVSIRMAKDQNLSLNPSKISGVCGRLMCCLKFECDSYRDCKAAFGDATPGEPLPDEFYDDVEGEEDYYQELLQEDGVGEVDYQLMVEAFEIEQALVEGGLNEVEHADQGEKAKKSSRSKKRRSKGGKKPKPTQESGEAGAPRKGEPKGNKKAEPKSEPKTTREAGSEENGAAGSKKKRRPRRRKPKAKPEEKAE